MMMMMMVVVAVVSEREIARLRQEQQMTNHSDMSKHDMFIVSTWEIFRYCMYMVRKVLGVRFQWNLIIKNVLYMYRSDRS